MKLKIKKLDPRAILPKYSYPGDSGIDLHCILEQPFFLAAGERVTLHTGIAIELPEGYEAQCRPRSGLGFKHGIVAFWGTVDNQFRNECSVCLFNHSFSTFKIENEMRVAQLVFTKVEQAEIEEVTELSDTVRGKRGFGSSGLQ